MYGTYIFKALTDFSIKLWAFNENTRKKPKKATDLPEEDPTSSNSSIEHTLK